MSVFTDLTRMWLTRSFKPFTFRNEYDEELPYRECDELGLYVHIPFCESICGFCPYCKVPYDEELCGRYIDALIREIHLVEKGRKNTLKGSRLQAFISEEARLPLPPAGSKKSSALSKATLRSERGSG